MTFSLGVDTRSLTQRIRERGTMMGYVVGTNEGRSLSEKENFEDPNRTNLVKEVSIKVSKCTCICCMKYFYL